MINQRVVVTGLGVISPVGVGKDSFWTALKQGQNGISRITHFDPTDYRSHMAGEVKDFNPKDWIDPKAAQRMDKFTHFGLAASTMAIQDAGLDKYTFNPERAGVIIGSGIGGSITIHEAYEILRKRGPRAISPFFISKILINMAACMVSITHNLKGPISASSVACSTGTNTIGEAFRILQRGDADIMLAGGSDACVNPLPFAGFCATRSMSTRNNCVEMASRPFDKDRDGFVMGEGAGIVVLEALDHALNRGARIYAELLGYGNTADAYHLTAPHPEGDGMVRVMKIAIKDANISPEDVEYINAHGTSTILNDKAESKAILKVFGDYAYKLKISSIKSMIGHLLAAAGAVEFISTVMSIFEGLLPPTINYETVDPECPFDYVANKAKKIDITVALTNSFGFGGGNASLVLKKVRSKNGDS